MERWEKECRKAVFWEVYWKTKASLKVPPKTKRCKMTGFIPEGISWSAA